MGGSVPLLCDHIRRHCEDRGSFIFSSPFVFLSKNVYIFLHIAMFVTAGIWYIYAGTRIMDCTYIRGLSRKYPAILNISITDRVALM